MQTENVSDKNIITIKLSKSYEFEGKEYKKLELDFESLTGNDLISAEKEARAMGDQTPMLEFSKMYQAIMAAKASKVPVDLIMKLSLKDFTNVTVRTGNFLFEEE